MARDSLLVRNTRPPTNDRRNIDEKMTNRLKDVFEQPEGEQAEDDYYVVDTRWEEFYVTRVSADRILRDLDASPAPEWIRFMDIYGSRVCLRCEAINFVRECTVAQRASERQFRRARRLEARADRRPWEDDD
jgi:hypothetical protein